jgi:hypothetical protein
LTLSTTDLIGLISAQSRAIAYDLVDPVARMLVVAREVCAGDFDKVLLMVVITLRSSQHPEFKMLQDADSAEHPSALPGFGTNARSLADSTGIPRETVRRKVGQLVKAGWVVRVGQTLCYSARGYEAVAPARDAIIRMYARGYQVLRTLEAAAERGA